MTINKVRMYDIGHYRGWGFKEVFVELITWAVIVLLCVFVIAWALAKVVIGD